ncbi:DNA repair protein RadC [Aeromonas hydrophila]|uniref:RadC family protein n=1 Tax=Aeromonas hydrophila TaxID=644 RepID=UPI00216878EE|nr:DNA repair protein RadC [Aeromonas hydrophila]MCS3791310.1 DNA repair protein RadC [Aeromonas hydrophila]MCX4039300.1 DNA repair protein RadC [Aeromonas hydrophila]
MRYHKLKAGECPGTYVVTEPVTEQDLLRIANQIARKRLAKGTAITSTTEATERLQTLLQDREHEVFGALFLDSQHRVLAFEELFRGTLDSASIYPREVVKRALLLCSASIIAVHNHPSGDPEPSQSDRVFTQALKEDLALVDVRLLDHLVVGAEGVVSLAERGQL